MSLGTEDKQHNKIFNITIFLHNDNYAVDDLGPNSRQYSGTCYNENLKICSMLPKIPDTHLQWPRDPDAVIRCVQVIHI